MGDSSFLTNFPSPVLTPVATLTSPPTFRSLQITQKELNANASSVYSNRGGGLHGHLALTIPTTVYDAKTTVPFVVPPVPPAAPDIPDGATQFQIAEANRQHVEDHKAFKLYHDVDKALRNLLIAATPAVYIETLEDPDYGFGGVTCLTMIQHLWTNYGRLSIADKDANLLRMHAPWHPPTPIESLFQQLQVGMRLSAAAGEPQVDAQVARIGYNIILNTGLFPDACREWRLLQPAAQTLAAFQDHFQRMNMDRLEAMTTSSAGYHGAANAAIQNPTPSVAPPTLEAIMAELQSLRAAANAAQAPPVSAPPKPQLPPTAYCWTHGASRNTAHTSATCRNKLEGHQDAASLTNKMGGSDRVWTRTTRRPQS